MCVLLFSFIRLILSLTRFPQELTQMSFHTSHQAGSKTSGSAAGVKFSPGCTVCSECAHILTHQFVWLCCPASHSRGEKKKKKTRAWGWHSSRGCKTRVFYWHHWAGSLQGGGGGWGALWSKPNMPRHMKRPGWPFPLRRLDAKAQATGRSQQRWAWLWEASLGAGARAGLGATLAPRLIFIHSLAPPCLISGHPERADIRTTWSEEKTTAHF